MFAFDKDGQLRGEPGAAPTREELKCLHKLIKKVTQDIEAFSYNTSISAFMICLNELNQLKCANRTVLEGIVTLLAPFCPHLCEELWEALGKEGSVCDAPWPQWDEAYLQEDAMSLTISFNGKARFQMQFPVDSDNASIEKAVLENPQSAKYMEGWQHVKTIIVPKKIVNIVLKK